MNTAQEGCGPNPRTYSKAEYDELSAKVAALEAELAKLRAGQAGWKLVPVEPTPEMVSAAEEAHMPFGDMDIALRMAILSAPSAPSSPATVQGVNQQLTKALEAVLNSGRGTSGRIILDAQDEADVRAAIAAARKGE